MDVMLCRGNIAQQFRHKGIAVRHDVYGVILEGQREILVDKQFHQLLMAVGHTEILLSDETEHRTLGQLVERTLAHHALTPMVHAEEEV